MVKPDKALQMLGMAMRAGKVKSGEFMTGNSVKDGSAQLVVVAMDASDNTKKQFNNMCDFYNVPIVFYETKEALGHCIGKEFRASLAVTDEGLATKILEIIDKSSKPTEVF